MSNIGTLAVLTEQIQTLLHGKLSTDHLLDEARVLYREYFNKHYGDYEDVHDKYAVLLLGDKIVLDMLDSTFAMKLIDDGVFIGANVNISCNYYKGDLDITAITKNNPINFQDIVLKNVAYRPSGVHNYTLQTLIWNHPEVLDLIRTDLEQLDNKYLICGKCIATNNITVPMCSVSKNPRYTTKCLQCGYAVYGDTIEQAEEAFTIEQPNTIGD